jgi:hypothetical protein
MCLRNSLIYGGDNGRRGCADNRHSAEHEHDREEPSGYGDRNDVAITHR